MNMSSLLQCMQVVVVSRFLTTLASWSGHWLAIRRSSDQSIVPLPQCQISLFRLWISSDRSGGGRSRATEGGVGWKCNLFEAILSGAVVLLPAARLCNYWQSLSCSFRAAGGRFVGYLDEAACLPAWPTVLLGHLGTWLFVFQRKGKLHKSEQLNFFRLKISARSTHKKNGAQIFPPKQTVRGSKSPRIDRKWGLEFSPRRGSIHSYTQLQPLVGLWVRVGVRVRSVLHCQPNSCCLL